MKIKLDIKKYPMGHYITVVQCEKCSVFYEPYGKIHKCKKITAKSCSGGQEDE